jgi:hypothetical protein
MSGSIAACANCGEHGYVMPLHDERGGPLFCFMCAGAWHAKHAPLRKARRVVIKALKAYEAAGGSLFGEKDFDELRLAACGFYFAHEADRIGDDFSDLTTELLNATIALTHPDKHPAERKAEANRVTQELHALKPFVFPAPAPEPPPERDALLDTEFDEPNKLSQCGYPCEDCRDAIPADYCDVCRAQHEKKWAEEHAREEKERERKNARQRGYYQINKAIRQPVVCAMCGEEFESKRSDAKYCSAACRQRAYVQRDGKVSNSKPLRSVDIERTIEIAFTTKPDSAFTTENLCQHVYGVEQVERKHRAVVIPIAKKVCEQLETWDWWQPLFSNRGLVFWNRVSLTSTAMSQIPDCDRYDSDEKRKAAISSGGDYYDRVVEGGAWWNAWQENIAKFKNGAAGA